MAMVSLRGYARHRGVSLKAVQKAVAAGRIQKTAAGQIDVESADVEWVRNTAPRPSMTPDIETIHAQPVGMHNGPQTVPSSGPTNGSAGHQVSLNTRASASAPESRLESSRGELPATSGLDYSRARAVTETYRAKLTRIAFEERSGKLVSRDEMKVAAFNKYRAFRDRMLNIPDRLAAILAAEPAAAKVHEILSTEIRKALLEFSDDTNSTHDHVNGSNGR
jgi:hypothetical protein